MTTIPVALSDELAAFVRRAVAGGAFPSADALFAHAVGLVRDQPGRTPPPAAVPRAVDLTRHGFDGAAFMAGLVGKLKG